MPFGSRDEWENRQTEDVEQDGSKRVGKALRDDRCVCGSCRLDMSGWRKRGLSLYPRTAKDVSCLGEMMKIKIIYNFSLYK